MQKGHADRDKAGKTSTSPSHKAEGIAKGVEGEGGEERIVGGKERDAAAVRWLKGLKDRAGLQPRCSAEGSTAFQIQRKGEIVRETRHLEGIQVSRKHGRLRCCTRHGESPLEGSQRAEELQDVIDYLRYCR